MPPSLEVHSGVAVRARALRNNGRVVQSAEGEVCVARVNGALKGMVAVNSQKPAEVQTAKHAHVPERRDELVVTRISVTNDARLPTSWPTYEKNTHPGPKMCLSLSLDNMSEANAASIKRATTPPQRRSSVGLLCWCLCIFRRPATGEST